MNTSGTSSDLQYAESQASQLLEKAFSGGNKSKANAEDSLFQTAQSVEAEASPQVSINSLPASSRGSAPVSYHFHGLAQTQSQSQKKSGEEEVTGASQKENLFANAETPLALSDPLWNPPRPHSSQNAVKLANVEQTSRHPAIDDTKGALGVQTSATCAGVPVQTSHSPVPFKSVAINVARTYPPAPRPFTESAPSQDSFAGEITQDPAREFLANHKVFEIPLSELGKTSTQETPPGGTADAIMFAHRAPSRTIPSPRRPAPSGHVLVESTSGSSQSQPSSPAVARSLVLTQVDGEDGFIGRQPSMVFEDDNRQFAHREVDAEQLTQVDELSQRSSSYERLLVGEPEEPTQPVEYEPTQPSDEFDLYRSDAPSDQAVPAANATDLPLVSPSNAPSKITNPRSLLSMVDPRKAWRYAKAKAQAAAQLPAPIPARAWPDLSLADGARPPVGTVTRNDEVVPETQRSHSPTIDTLPGNNTQPIVSSPPRAPLISRRPQYPDPMDVVPDSEPPAETESPSPPTPPRRVLTEAKSPVEMNFPIVPDEDQVDLPRSIIVDTEVLRAAGSEQQVEVLQAPLAPTKRSQAKGKGKRKPPPKKKGKAALPCEAESELSMPPPPPLPKGKASKSTKSLIPAAKKGKRKRDLPETDVTVKLPRQTAAVKRKRDSPEEVPSSAPIEDANRIVFSRKGKGVDVTIAPSLPPRTRTRSTTSNGPSAAKKRRLSTDSEDELGLLWNQAAVGGDDVDEGTEPADEDPVLEQADSAPIVVGQSSKGRKQPSRATTRSVSRTSTRMSKQSFLTSILPATKNLSTALMDNRLLSMVPTKVMALWKQDGHYYSGTVAKCLTGNRYTIEFDDTGKDTVSLSDMRLGDLHVGDIVLICQGGQKATVVQVSTRKAKRFVLLETTTDGDVEEIEVEMGEIMIAPRTILTQWSDRMVSAGSVYAREDTEMRRTAPSAILSNIGLVTTLSPSIHRSEQLREELTQIIEQHGGVVIEDFSKVMSITGKSSHGQQWIAEETDLAWAGLDIERLYLLSDDASQKPKYLEALALGVPCLSLNWLNDILQHDHSSGPMDWQPYLLPQGYAHSLHARVSQFVDLDWCNSSEHLQQIMNNPVAPKPLKGKSILCIHRDFLPDGRGQAAAVPRIILAMGAARLEAVSDAKYSSMELSRYDYLIVKEGEGRKKTVCADVAWADVAWVKGCLIAGRLLPVHQRSSSID